MSKEHELFLECYAEVKRKFSGSAAHVLKEMATRLFEEARQDKSRQPLMKDEREIRYTDLFVALQTIPQWPGLRPGERPVNAKE